MSFTGFVTTDADPIANIAGILSTSIAMFAAKRLGKELQKAKQHLPPGIDLVKADDFQEWQMDIRVLDNNPLYNDQIFRLCFRFGTNYPIGTQEICLLEPCFHPARVSRASAA